jgi:hypothetical protein
VLGAKNSGEPKPAALLIEIQGSFRFALLSVRMTLQGSCAARSRLENSVT